MPRASKLDDLLERLVEVRRKGPETPEGLAVLREALAFKSAHAAASAAAIAGDAQIAEVQPELVAAFERFMKNPVKSDPGCRGKTAIVDALQALDSYEGEIYLQAARSVQLEPVYGGREDTAALLRGAAARGLVRMNHPDAMLILAELLADAEVPARIAAARAIGYHGGEQGLPLLRLKVLVGDPEMEVVGDCLLAMLQISPGSSVSFVSRLLASEDPALAEAAALALGESRSPEALAALMAGWEETVDRDLGRAILLGIAMIRSDDAISYLLRLIQEESGPNAREAIRAFEIYRNDDAMVERVRDTARQREDLDLTAAVEEHLA